MNTRKPSVAIVGAGALGTLLGARLCAVANVTVVDRAQRCDMISASGLQLEGADGVLTIGAPESVTDSFDGLPVQDYVIIAVKAYDIPVIAPSIPSLFHEETAVITVQNGIPWWYFLKHGGRFEGVNLLSLDPQGIISSSIPAERLLGCVAYPAAESVQNGCVRHVEGDRFPIGELSGEISARAEGFARLLNEAGFRSRVIPDIRSEIWLKAWGALSINPISALTRGRMDQICEDRFTMPVVAAMMREAEQIANYFGVAIRHTPEKRIEGARKVGPHKTSMLCDLEAGSEMEVDSLIGSIVELADIANQEAPSIRAVHACLRMLNANSQAMPSASDPLSAIGADS